MLLGAGNTKEFALVPKGTHMARCYLIADMGTQSYNWKGEEKQSRQIRFSWEIPGQCMDDGRPFVIGNKYTASLGEKAKLRAILEAWRGDSFTEEEIAALIDPGVFLGKPCLLSVTHDYSANSGRTYANVGSVVAVPDGINVPTCVNELVYFSLDNFSQEAYDKLPEWLRKDIAKSPEYQAIVEPVAPDRGFTSEDLLAEGDIPF